MNIRGTYDGLKTLMKWEEAPSQIKELSKRVAEMESQNGVKDQQIKTLIERMAFLEGRAQTQTDIWQKDFSKVLVQLEILALDSQRSRTELKAALGENRDLVHQVIELKAQLHLFIKLLGVAGVRLPLNLPPAD